jgi:hypothetical protein
MSKLLLYVPWGASAATAEELGVTTMYWFDGLTFSVATHPCRITPLLFVTRKVMPEQDELLDEIEMVGAIDCK